ncbi:hypothetical protein ACFFKU_09830 [Kineococcus gynurae]|uniref:Uncharacterized protein n=1 Tax=Kineococcus gynurae TaxID=452979 RepID=A0ABV5LVC2_9ACTN
MKHWGGTGRYVEGERVFAPPAGSFDADWVAGIVQDRHGVVAGDRGPLAAAAQAAWDARCAGEPCAALRAAAARHVPDWLAAEVVQATDDFIQAYRA